MRGNEQDVVERQCAADDTHRFSPDAKIDYTRVDLFDPADERSFDVGAPLDYLDNVMFLKDASMDARQLARVALTAVALASVALAGPASAALYKWTDANGRVVYSDQPPPAGSGATAEVLRAPPPPANPNAVKEMAAKDADFRKRQTDRADDAKKAEKSKADADRRTDNCAQLRGQAKLMTADELVYRMNEKGERVYMDDAAKAKERERIEGLMREHHCPPA
jgi:hypothetical protein